MIFPYFTGQNRTALIAGASGQVGCDLLELILKHRLYRRITVLVREPLKQKDTAINEVIVPNFDDLEKYAASLKGDDIFLCLGTSSTNPESFSRVDYDYPLSIARIAHANGASLVLFVSALGADPKSMNRYFRTKGKIELALEAIRYPSAHFFRPAILYGHKDRERPVQAAARVVTQLVGWLFLAKLAKYRAISSHNVATAMLRVAVMRQLGVYRYESDHIASIACAIE